MGKAGGGQAGKGRARLRSLVADVARSGFLLAIPGLAAWATGRHMIFPSLGPTAFVLGVRGGPVARAWPVIGGHLVGVLSGMIVYHTIVYGVVLNPMPGALSWAGFRLAVGAIVALMITVAGMVVSRTPHAAACSTTLIVAMGELSRWTDGLLIMGSVIAMYAAHAALRTGPG